MPRLLPHDAQKIRLLLNIDTPVANIAQNVGCSRQTVYCIRQNLELFGQPYPPKDAYRTGRLPKLSAGQVQVGDP